MTYQDWLGFECMIIDRIQEESIDNGRDLSDLADEFHQHVEIAFQDWADDEGIEDYEPSY